MRKRVFELIRDACGATAIEYALIASLIGVAIIAAAALVGTDLNGTFSNVAVGFG